MQRNTGFKFMKKLKLMVSQGTVILNYKKVNWRIHAGGIGFIKSNNIEQVYVCSEEQCKTIPGLFYGMTKG